METERKYPIDDPAAIAARLHELGFQGSGRYFESNLVFDTPDLSLFGKDCLLRLRTCEWPDRISALLTFKGPTDQAAARERGVKSREELETGIADPGIMARILGRLGYRQIARYEKVREEWRKPGESDLAIDLDILPFGAFLEIEAGPAAMESMEAALHLDKSEIGLKTYHEINQEWRDKNGLPPARDIVFAEQRKLRLRSELGLS